MTPRGAPGRKRIDAGGAGGNVRSGSVWRTESRLSRSVEPADALLVVDIGNSRIGLGIWDHDGLHDARRVPADQPEELRAAVTEIWSRMPAGKRAVVLASVAPRTTAVMAALLEDITGCEPVRVGEDIPLPMPVEVADEHEVGVDRVCSAAAAFERVGAACAVASFGTAITVDCVSAEGRFLGGAILPGMQMSCNALHAGTALLPRVSPAAPSAVFGRSTHEAIVNGVVYGVLGALREIVERYATELREWPKLVITGGNAPLVAELADYVDAVVPDLCLMGVALAYREAAGQP